MRHPWLQMNLITAFTAGAVVGIFEDTIQQALAVTLRAMTLNELKPGMEAQLVRKEAIVGIMNGMLVGLTAGAAMLGYAILNGSAVPIMLAIIVIVAMLGSCAAAGVAGVLIPLPPRRFGYSINDFSDHRDGWREHGRHVRPRHDYVALVDKRELKT
jgi:magnesium transporter